MNSQIELYSWGYYLHIKFNLPMAEHEKSICILESIQNIIHFVYTRLVGVVSANIHRITGFFSSFGQPKCTYD